MIICPNCKAVNQDDDLFCGECGTRLEGVQPQEDTQIQDQIQTQQVETPAPENAQPWDHVQPQEFSGQQNEQQSGKFETLKRRPREENQQQTQQQQPVAGKQLKKIDWKKAASSVKRFDKYQKMIAAEILVLVVTIIAFIAIGTSRSSAQSVASRYFKAYMNGDAKTMYELTNLPDSKFLTEEEYAMYYEGHAAPDIKKYKVKVGKAGSDSFMRVCTVEYTESGSSYPDTKVYYLVQQEKKFLFFFPTWKVVPDDIVNYNFSIYLPEGASATLNGVLLTEEDLEWSEGGTNCYNVTIFSGPNELTIAAPWHEIYETTMDPEDWGYEYYATDLVLTQEATDSLEGMVKDTFKKMYQAAVVGEDYYESVASLFPEDCQESNKQVYENLVEEIQNRGSYKLDSITFDQFEFDIADGYEGSGINVDGSYEYQYNYTYTYSSWFSGETRTEKGSYNGNSWVNATFRSTGDRYELTYIDFYSVF